MYFVVRIGVAPRGNVKAGTQILKMRNLTKF